MSGHESLARLIGRDQSLEVVRATLARERLVTLRGPPGVGKTRLALEIARTWSTPADVCELEQASDARELCTSVASVLGVPLVRADAVGDVAASLEARGPTLLVLDNFEQLPIEATRVVERWIGAAPLLRVLATSRHALESEREVTVLVEPLDTSGPTSSALALLLARARSVRADFDEPDADLLARLVDALEGLPLAIELAAPRLATLGAASLLERIDTRLAWRERRMGERRSTLEATFDASWQLLEPAERAALAQCSVFRGTFDLEAAEAIVSAGAPVLDLLVGLERKSLLRVLASPGGRFGLLASVRDSARGRLSDDDRRAAHDRHADYYTVRAGREAARVNTRDDGAATDWLRRETDNLVQVIEAGGPRSLEAALALSKLWIEEGPIQRGAALLERALAGASPPALEARARLAYATLALRIAPSATHAEIERATALAEREGDRAAVALGRRLSGEVTWWIAGRTKEARDLFEEAMTIAAGVSAFEEAMSAHRLAQVLAELDEPEQGLRHAERALALHRSLGAERRATRQLYQVAALHLATGRTDRARETLSHVARGAEGELARDVMGTLIFNDVRAELFHREANLPEALAGWEACARSALRLGFVRNGAVALGYAGIALRELGRRQEARELLLRAIAVLRDVGDERVRAFFEGMLGGIEAEEGRVDDAEATIETARQTCERLGAEPLATAVALQHVIVDRARAARSVDPAEARRLSARADERLARGGGTRSKARSATPTFEVYLALRSARLRPTRGPAREVLAVERSGRFFRAPDTEPTDLRRSPVLRALAVALAAARLDRPGTFLRASELVSAGWPSERMAKASAGNRLRVALSTLRRLGLRDLLQRDAEGWRLDPDVPCEWVHDPAADGERR